MPVLASRRSIFCLPVAASALLENYLSAAAVSLEPPDEDTWTRLNDVFSALAKLRNSGKISESSYIAKILDALKGFAPAPAQSPSTLLRQLRHPIFTELRRTDEYQLTLIQMSANQVIPLHDHPQITGICKCLAGKVDVSGYRVIAQESESDFLFASAGTKMLRKGDTFVVTQQGVNIH